ncbi:MAG TPA: hypothetical protein VK473_02620 [Terriglobales bacterium]|nr:hypothetical protein [Terriglobales bacterium]
MAGRPHGDYRLLTAANAERNRTASLAPNYHGIVCPGCGREASFGDGPPAEEDFIKYMVLNAARFACPACGEDEVYMQERILHSEAGAE